MVEFFSENFPIFCWLTLLSSIAQYSNHTTRCSIGTIWQPSLIGIDGTYSMNFMLIQLELWNLEAHESCLRRGLLLCLIILGMKIWRLLNTIFLANGVKNYLVGATPTERSCIYV